MKSKLIKKKAGEPVKNQIETWYLETPHKNFEWKINTSYHKPINILTLKSRGHKSFNEKAESVAKERKNLFSENDFVVDRCPICLTTRKNDLSLNVYGASYVNCSNCTHRYVMNRLSKKRLEEYYRTSNSYQATYTEKKTARARLEDIHIPKLKWLLDEYKRFCGSKPKAILDVGAGSGHFVACCRDSGIKCDGIELSDSGRTFAKNIFGVDLIDADFMKEWKYFIDQYDIVTFWGLIEHVADPLEMLNTSKKILEGRTSPMIVASVPRWHSLSSTIQSIFPNKIIRHLDPLGHIQLFTDTSICVSLAKTNLQPIAFWYFGMDVYELLIQLAAETGTDKAVSSLLIETMQKTIDEATLSDSMVFAAILARK